MRPPLRRHLVIAIVIVAVMSCVAAVGFRSTLSGWGFVVPAAVGMVAASALVLFAAWRRLLLGESVALSAIGFVVIGGVAVGGVPTPDAYSSFFRGMVDGWADLLSASPPADITTTLRALPFTVAWLAAALGGEIARHTRRPGLPAIGPLIALALSLLFIVEDRGLALAQGAGILAGTLALVAVAQRTAQRVVTADGDRQPPDQPPSGTSRRRIALGALLVGLTVAAAPLVGPRLPLAEANERFDLRRFQEPPFDPLAVPSPLVQLKASLKDERKDDVVFEVSGETPIGRWPVAVMNDYDGVVWTVADPEGAAAQFVPVDTHLPETERELPDGTATVEHTVEIVDLNGAFLPVAGVAQRLDFAGETDRDPRLNLLTGSVALPGGVTDGLAYEVTSAVSPAIPETRLTTAAITPVDRTEELELLQPPVRNLAADLLEGKESGWPQVAAIRDKFVQEGFYDSSEEIPPGHSSARLGSMLEDPDRIVGYGEQYAAAAAVMTRVATLPTRVVVGYVIPDDRWADGHAEVLAGDIAAWIEIDAGPLGWIPVDVTPDESRVPDPQSQGVTIREVAIPNPPPPPPPPPDVEPPQQEEEEIEEEEEEDDDEETSASGGLGLWAWVAIGGASLPIVLLVLLAAAILAVKSLRRRHRRRASAGGQVAGAWAEAVDRCTEAGAPLVERATPHETIGVYLRDRSDLAEIEPELRTLAREVDRAAFAASAPTDEQVGTAWRCSDEVRAEIRRSARLGRRVKMRLDPRPLRHDHARAK